jgi:rsbT co-antagonist protein RsbR
MKTAALALSAIGYRLFSAYTTGAAMGAWLRKILHVQSTDPDTQQRGRILIAVTLGMIILGLCFVPIIATSPRRDLILSLIGGTCAIFLGAAYLGRIGRVTVGSYIVIGLTTLAILSSIYTDQSTPSAPVFLVLAILLAGVLLPPMQIWLVFVVCVVGALLVFGLLPAELRSNPIWVQGMRGGSLILLMASIITFVSARGTSVAIRETRAARAQAEAAARQLAETNTSLETRVAERTAELTRVLDEQRLTLERLEASLASQRDMNRVIAELSVPIIPIGHDSLVVPLIGAIDSGRASQLLDDLLAMIEETSARTVILDVTGVVVIDTQVAGALLRVASTARLMGARTMLVGIRPEVAQTLVGIGVNLETLYTAASLDEGLALARKLPR